jgi:hypothetical protein
MAKTEKAIEALRQYLAGLSCGPVEESFEVARLLAPCWHLFDGSHREGMDGSKLHGRMESLTWEPPVLSFQIERHGGTVNGSSRAEVQGWDLNIDNMTAVPTVGSYRQVKPRAAALSIEPLVDDVVACVLGGTDTHHLRWDPKSGHARVLIGKVIANSGPKATVQGRRNRFAKKLQERLLELGWEQVPGKAAHTFRRQEASSSPN